jgi:hypothetical protein
LKLRTETSVGNLSNCRCIIKSAIVESGVKPPHSKARFARETGCSVSVASAFVIRS